MGRLIIDGNNVYEIDENCIKNHGIDCEFCLLKRIFEKVENSY